MGTPAAEVTTDIDGATRSATTPDIGADEYTSTNIPLQGTYTIGAGGNYTTISLAVDDLITKGVTGAVTFNILSGSYNEQFIISQITGASSTFPIVFQSQSGNPDDVVINFNGASTNNYIVSLDGADYITFKNLKFQADNSQYSRIIVFNGNAQNNNIIGNKFQGRVSTSNLSEDAIIYAFDNTPIIHNTTIQDNIFINGSFSLYLVGPDLFLLVRYF
jgi:pectin methylesterase-like acyl-CoA thioesterase